MTLVDVNDHRRFDEITRAKTFATASDSGAQFATKIDVAGHPVLLPGGDQRAHLHLRI
ncbi:hypothetical protein D9M71_468210 [compost metagenome]